METISYRVPRNIRRNCSGLRVKENIGLVCESRHLAFTEEWVKSPCFDPECPSYEPSNHTFQGVLDVPCTPFLVKRKSVDANPENRKRYSDAGEPAEEASIDETVKTKSENASS